MFSRDSGGRAPGWGALVILFAATFAAGAVGALASAGAPEFYQALARPSWAPPPSVFGPVWTVLYAMIATAAFIVVRAEGWSRARLPIALYGTQLAVNALWTWTFFAWGSGLAAFADIVLLVALVAVTLGSFWRVRVAAGVLLIPYLAWITFASVLTWYVWRRNPSLL